MAMILALMLSPSVSAQASGALHPACGAAQIRVSAGATAMNTTYSLVTAPGTRRVLAYEAVPVYFYNRGGVCHLLMGAPAVQAVRHATQVPSLKTLPMRDVSIGTTAENNRRRLITHHQRLEVLVVVIRPVGPAFVGCDPATTTGIIMQGYAGPVGTFAFIPRRLSDVCFDAGLGRVVDDIGVLWPSA